LPGSKKVVDRVVARVEEDIILQSDVEQLARYQIWLTGSPRVKREILDRLIDQWIVRKEAEASHFPGPVKADVDRGLQRLERSFAKKEDFDAQRKKAGISEGELLQIVTAQAYFEQLSRFAI